MPFVTRSPIAVLTLALALVSSLFAQAFAQVDLSAPPVRFTSGNVVDLAIGDFDEDGFQDYAINLASPNRIEIWRNDGFEGFDLVTTIPDTGRQVRALDWNGDGHLDLVTGRVSIFLGDGDGGFTIDVDQSSSLVADAITIARFDDDAHLDVIVTNEEFETIAILLGDGAGGLLPAEVTFAPSPGNVAVGDVDGDSHADLLIPNRAGGTLSYWRGDGTGVLPEFGIRLVDSGNPNDVRTADFDGDSHLDLIVLLPTLGIAYGDGTGRFAEPPVPLGPLTNTLCLLVEDLDGDGILDAAVGGRSFPRHLSIYPGLGGGAVGERVDYRSPSGRLSSLATGDVDGDGILDIVAHTDEFGSSLATYLGKSDGTFRLPAIEATTPEPAKANAPRSIVTGHFDADDHLDVATISFGNLYVLFGDGAGDFTFAQSVSVDYQALATADLNDDTFPDLVAVSIGNESVDVFLGSMNGDFTPLPPVHVAAGCRSISFGDFDGNSFLDVATANGDDTDGNDVSILLGDGTGTLVLDATYTAGRGPNFIVSGDFNEDGFTDLGVANEYSRNVTLLTTDLGPGDFTTLSTITTDNDAESIALTDLDDDADLDAAVSGDDGRTSILRNDGSGAFDVAQQLTTGIRSGSIEALDLDGDARLDLLIKNQNPEDVVVHRNGGPGTGFTPAESFPIPTTSNRARVGDLTNDGIPDVVALSLGNFDRIVTLAGRAAGDFARLEEPITLAFEPDVLEKVDLDSNGTLDVIAAQGGGSISYFQNDGFANFTRSDFATGSGAIDIATGFFNGDSFPDIAVACEDDDLVTIYLGSPAGPASRRDVVVGSAPSAVAAGDFDEDGNTDLVVANADSNTATLLFGDGLGAFSTETFAGELYEPLDVIVGHFDDLLDPDGHADLAFVNDASTAVVVLTGDGNGNFTNPAAFPVTLAPRKIAAGDFDEDGHLDIVVTALVGVTQVFFGTGFGTFPDPVTLPISGESIDLADVDRDGRIDILVTNDLSGDALGVVLANGTRAPGPAFSFALDNPGAFVAGDFDDERDVDVVVGTPQAGPLRLLRNRSLDPLRCRAGNVNDLVGTRAETLTVNESIGAPSREVAVDSTESVRVALERAPTPAAGNSYYVGVWAGRPTSATTARIPAFIGSSCFQMIRNQPGYLMPIEVARTLRPTDPRLDPPSGTATGDPIPGEVLVIPAGLAPGTVLTVQGILGDGATKAAKSVSLTNAVVVTVE